MSKDEHYRALTISKDKIFRVLFENATSSFLNNYLDVGLKAW